VQEIIKAYERAEKNLRLVKSKESNP